MGVGYSFFGFGWELVLDEGKYFMSYMLTFLYMNSCGFVRLHLFFIQHLQIDILNILSSPARFS
jgi:hypothetical protein